MSDDARRQPRTAALRIDDLEVAYLVRGVPREVLRGVSFEVAPGEAYGLVGESGCGKSTTAYAALRYLPSNGRITGGHVYVDGNDVTGWRRRDLRRCRARDASMVYQDPGAVAEPGAARSDRRSSSASRCSASPRIEAERAGASRRCGDVRIADPVRVMQRYPHQLSGGMQQRVVIAMALACNPKLLVLDEPTTGLDATVEAEVLDLVRALRTETDAAILLIAHNLGVIRTMCDRVGVMYAGKVVEEGPAQQVFDDPQHPYTVGLLSCLPRHGIRKGEQLLATIPGTLPQIGTPLPTCVFVDRCPARHRDLPRRGRRRWSQVGPARSTRCHHADRIGEILASRPTPRVSRRHRRHRVVLEMRDVSKTFRQHRHDVPALVGVDLGLEEGETLGLVGESGSGKSTLAKTMLGIHAPDEGGEVADRRQRSWRARPATARPTSGEPCRWCSRTPTRRSTATGPCGGSSSGRSSSSPASRARAADDRVEKLAESLRLSPRHLDLKPRQLSGGLKQRVAIARAFAGDPRIVVCDEPTSALDVSVQAAILNVLAELQAGERTSYLFISHDLGVVRYLSRPHRRDVPRPHHGDRHAPSRSSTVPTTRTRRPCCRRCRASTVRPATRIPLAGEIPSPPTRRRDACSTPAATASSRARAT